MFFLMDTAYDFKLLTKLYENDPVMRPVNPASDTIQGHGTVCYYFMLLRLLTHVTGAASVTKA